MIRLLKDIVFVPRKYLVYWSTFEPSGNPKNNA